jgi:hypothetical protein
LLDRLFLIQIMRLRMRLKCLSHMMGNYVPDRYVFYFPAKKLIRLDDDIGDSLTCTDAGFFVFGRWYTIGLAIGLREGPEPSKKNISRQFLIVKK